MKIDKHSIFSICSIFLLSLVRVNVYCQQTNTSDQQIPGKAVVNNIQDNLLRLTHKFVYLVSVDAYGNEMSIPLVKDGASHFSAWKPDSNINVITATAFIVDKEGHCITSDYAVEPWNNENDQIALKTAFSQQLGIPKEAITVSGMSQSIELKNTGISDTGVIILENNMEVPGVGWVQLKRFAKDQSDSELVSKIPGLSQENTLSILPKAALYSYGYSSLNQVLPVEQSVTVAGNTNHSIQLEAIKKTLPEGAPFFDSKGNLLGIYTNFNKKTTDNHLYFPLISIHQ
ncbi:MAG TPA: hypothetical protein VLS85_02580 [Hanamia sp.]|nr:hypothetical protein [Hanamia sp.]